MKKHSFVLFLSAIILFSNTSIIFSSSKDEINSIIGDISFISKYGFEPSSASDDVLRIKTHLQYVENILRNSDITSMSPEMKTKRIRILNLLHQYIVNGIFPENYDYIDEHKPCFIDKYGRICAVGYLIEQTSGRQVAEQINSKHKYELIKEMNDIDVDVWILKSGLTEEECAMIQPQYGFEKDNVDENGKILLSGGLTAANISLNVINGINMANNSRNTLLQITTLLTGLTQATVGIIYISNNNNPYASDYSQTEKILSAMDIGVGISSMILTIWNLTSEKKPEKNKTSWNIFPYPSPGKEIGIGLSLKHSF